MLTIVFVSVAAALLVVIAVCLAAFYDAAFRAPAQVQNSGVTMGNWQPPLLRGRELLNWASATARTVTMEFLDRRRTAKTATELSSELHVGVTAAINQEACSDRQVGCPAFCHSEIVVTPPEVLGIADYLRQNRPPDELRRVKERAAANCRRLAVTDRTQSAGEDVCCPLMDGRDACCAFPVRPIRCRGRDVSPISNFDRKPLDPHEYESRSHVVVQGAEFGFCSGLKASGLDGNLYELNSALVAVLDAPDAAERWAKGESIFPNCNDDE